MRERLYIDKNEDLSEIVKKLPAVKAEEITLVVPEGAVIFESLENMAVLKDAAAKLGSRLTIETEDPRGRRLAASLGLAHESFAPAFGPKVYDIIPPREAKTLAAVSVGAKIPPAPKEIPAQPRPKEIPSKFEQPLPFTAPQVPAPGEFKEERKRVRLARLARRMLLILIPLGIAAVFIAMHLFFSEAIITVKLRRSVSPFSEKITVKAAVASVDVAQRVIPGQKLELTETMQMTFRAKDKTEVRERARGTVRVVNAFSSSRQLLVAGTRFTAPDGKIFRIEKQLVIPGAKVEGGAVVSSAIETTLVADEPGEAGNIKAGTKFDIPGFAGTPKFSGFWAEAKSDFAGGFVGEVWVVRAQDLEVAQGELRSVLTKKLEDGLTNHLTEGLGVLDVAKSLDIPSATSSVAAGGWAENFILSGRGVLSALAFRESDLESLLTSLLGKSDEKAVKTSSLKTTFEFASRTGKWDKTANTLELELRGRAFVPEDFDLDLFEQRILGKQESEVREIVLSTAAIDSAHLKLSPFWRKSVPGDPSRVTFQVE